MRMNVIEYRLSNYMEGNVITTARSSSAYVSLILLQLVFFIKLKNISTFGKRYNSELVRNLISYNTFKKQL